MNKDDQIPFYLSKEWEMQMRSIPHLANRICALEKSNRDREWFLENIKDLLEKIKSFLERFENLKRILSRKTNRSS